MVNEWEWLERWLSDGRSGLDRAEAAACWVRCLTYAWHPPNTRHQSPYQPGSPLPPFSPIHNNARPLLSTATTHRSTTAFTSKVRFTLAELAPSVTRRSISSPPQMSATQKVQQHPAFIQAQDKANYYVNQLDKEVCVCLILRTRPRLWWKPDEYERKCANHATLASSPSTRL